MCLVNRCSSHNPRHLRVLCAPEVNPKPPGAPRQPYSEYLYRLACEARQARIVICVHWCSANLCTVQPSRVEFKAERRSHASEEPQAVGGTGRDGAWKKRLRSSGNGLKMLCRDGRIGLPRAAGLGRTVGNGAKQGSHRLRSR